MHYLCGVCHWNVLIHQEGPTHLPHRDHEIITKPENRVNRLQTWKASKEIEHCQSHWEGNIFEDANADKVTSSLSKLASMPQDKLAQTSKLRYGVVWERGGLIAFFPQYTDANVRRLNHIHIVWAISDRECNFAWVMRSYELHDLLFLLWRGPVYYDWVSSI